MINFQDNHYFKRLIYSLETGGDSDYGFVEINSFQGKNDFIEQLRENCSKKIVEVDFSPKAKDNKEENTELVHTYQHFLTIENFRREFGDETILVFTNLHETVDSFDDNSVMELVAEINMNRENYARYPSTVLFIFPKWLMDKVFQNAHDLISMRAFHFDFTEIENNKQDSQIMTIKDYERFYLRNKAIPNLDLRDSYKQTFLKSGYPLLERLNAAKKYIEICYYYYIKDDESVELFKEIESFIEKIEINSQKRANIIFKIYSGFGTYERNFANYKSALYFYEKALNIIEDKYDVKHILKSEFYNNIASIYFDMENYEKALNYFNKSLSIIESVFPKDNPLNSVIYNNIAIIYIKKGDYVKALDYFNKSFSIEKKYFNANNLIIASFYNNTASIFSETGNYDKALHYYKMALSIIEKCLGLNHPDVADTYNFIANVYFKTGNYDKALNFSKKALEIRKKVQGINNVDTAISYNNIAHINGKTGDYKTALKYLIKAYKIIVNILGENHPKSKNIFGNISFCYLQSGKDSSDFVNWLKQQLEASDEE